jgi:hypothetical protein
MCLLNSRTDPYNIAILILSILYEYIEKEEFKFVFKKSTKIKRKDEKKIIISCKKEEYL